MNQRWIAGLSAVAYFLRGYRAEIESRSVIHLDSGDVMNLRGPMTRREAWLLAQVIVSVRIKSAPCECGQVPSKRSRPTMMPGAMSSSFATTC